MIKKSGITNIVKEDILRILGEKKEKVSLQFIKAIIKVRYSFVSKAIKYLKEKDLIHVKEGCAILTNSGRVQAENILRKHLILEKYFLKVTTKEKAHRKANILEHYISEEVARNIKKISTLNEKGISLTEFKQKNGLITDIVLGAGLFERIVSMGIFPGEKIKKINEIPSGIVIEVKNKKFVLDKNIAKKIKVSGYEKT